MIAHAPIKNNAGVKVPNFARENNHTQEFIISVLQNGVSWVYVNP